MKKLLLWLALGVFALSLLTCFTIIEQGEIGVVRRFGRVLPEKPGPGLFIGLPWWIDRVERVQVDKFRSVTIGYAPEEDAGGEEVTPAGQLLTGDHNIVNIQAVVYYAVDPDRVEEFAFQQDQAAAVVERLAEAVLTEWVAGRTIDQVLLEGKATRLGPGKVALPEALVRETERRLENSPYRLGVILKDARVTHLSPPAEVKEAFEKVTRAETQIRTMRYEAERLAARNKRTAEAEEYRLQRSTMAYAREQELQARADAVNFLTRLRQYREMKQKNPYYLNVLWWDEMNRLYARMQANGRIDLLDHHLAGGGLDITQVPPLPGKR